MDIKTIRQTIKNNDVDCTLRLKTDKKFLPHALVDHGFFDSTSEVRRNRPDLWKEIDGKTEIGRITIHWEVGDGMSTMF